MNSGAVPRVTEVREGWLASTPPEHQYRVGVVGQNREEALERLMAAMEAWEELHSRPVSGR